MQLVECLSLAPFEQVRRIAATVGMDPGAGSEELTRALAANLNDRAWLQAMLADLSAEDWTALKVVFFNGADQGITVELCHQIVNLLSGKRSKSSARAIENLQSHGLVYARTQNYRHVYFIPTDLLQVLGEILNRQMIFRVCLPPEQGVRPFPMDRDLLEDLHRFLAYLFKNEVTLTQQGQIFKRHLRLILELFVEGQTDEESLVGRYPEPLGFLVGYVMDRRLVSRMDGRLQITEELNPWISQETGVKREDLFAYWQERYFYQDLQTFLSVIRSVGQQWIAADRLVAEAEPLINPSQRGSFLLRLKHHLSTFLVPMGLIELGQPDGLSGESMACRLTPDGEAILSGTVPRNTSEAGGPGLILQATYEILVPRPCPTPLLWTLELVADLLHRTDRTLSYRLSRQSVYRALKTGMRGESILAFFNEHSATGVPQNVGFDLKGWSDTYGQVYLQSAMLLRCATPALAEQVKLSRRTGRFVIGELSSTILLVHASQSKELLEALEADQMMPCPDVKHIE